MTPQHNKVGAADRPTPPGQDGPPDHFIPDIPQLHLPHDDKGEPHYSTWIVVRYDNVDSGNRPLPGGTVFWESPDVWTVGSKGVNQPVPNEPTKVYARVTNFGLQAATGIFVDFWWANPALAITHANAHQVGTGYIPSLSAANGNIGSSTLIQCPNDWVPVIENNGHECLLAEAYIPGFDALSSPMDPVDDRHVGQKNEQLVLANAGQMIKFPLVALNISPLQMAVTVELHPLVLKTVPHLITMRAGLLRSHFERIRLKPPATPLPVSVNLSDKPALYSGSDPFFARRLLSMAVAEASGNARDCSPPPQFSETRTFAPWEGRQLEIETRVPADAQPGQTFGFRVLQRAGRMITGGYTVFVLVRPR